MFGTRDQVMAILHEQGGSTVLELADTVGVGQGAIRRHLDIMVAEGLIESQVKRQRRGRPTTLYSLSDSGEERSAPGNYFRLLKRLLDALARLPSGAVDGKMGSELLDQAFEEVAQGISVEHGTRVQGANLQERVEEVTITLQDEGILDEFMEERNGFRLSNSACPYRSVAGVLHAQCEADRRAIELLVDVPVQQLSTIADGDACCEYMVEKPTL